MLPGGIWWYLCEAMGAKGMCGYTTWQYRYLCEPIIWYVLKHSSKRRVCDTTVQLIGTGLEPMRRWIGDLLLHVQENLLDRLQKELKELKETANISLVDNAVSSLQ